MPVVNFRLKTSRELRGSGTVCLAAQLFKQEIVTVLPPFILPPRYCQFKAQIMEQNIYILNP